MQTIFADLGEHYETKEFQGLPPILRELAIVAAEYREISDQIGEAASKARKDSSDAYELLSELQLTCYKQWQSFEQLCQDVRTHYFAGEEGNAHEAPSNMGELRRPDD